MARSQWFANRLRGAAVLALLAASPAPAEAAFTVLVDGVIVATDQGAGDLDADTGVIRFVDTVGSHQIRLTALADPSLPGAGDFVSELQTLGDGAPGDPAGDLRVSDSATFPGGGGTAVGLRNGLALDRAGGPGSSGSVGSFATAVASGALAATPALVLGPGAAAGQSEAVFAAPGGGFELTQTVFVNDLLAGDGLTATSSAEAVAAVLSGDESTGQVDVGEVLGVISTPVPAGAVLLLTGLPVVGLYRRRLLST